MFSLDEIPFKVALDRVEISSDEKDPVGHPEIKIPDCTQILRETKVRLQMTSDIAEFTIQNLLIYHINK